MYEYMNVVAGVPYEVRVTAATNGGEGKERRLIFFLEELGKFWIAYFSY